jgi:hypothetical protein
MVCWEQMYKSHRSGLNNKPMRKNYPISPYAAVGVGHKWQPLKSQFTPEFVTEAVVEASQVPLSRLVGKSRFHSTTQARFALCYYLYTYCELSSTAVGALLGGRDHSTVLHAKTTFLDDVRFNYKGALDLAEKIAWYLNNVPSSKTLTKE